MTLFELEKKYTYTERAVKDLIALILTYRHYRTSHFHIPKWKNSHFPPDFLYEYVQYIEYFLRNYYGFRIFSWNPAFDEILP